MLKWGLLASFIFCYALVQAQDPQFSQYYSAPLYLNPAFAGSSGCTRVISNYRNQWFGLNQPYNTFAFSIDHNIDRYNSGVGIQFLSDQVGKNGISTVSGSLFYSYRIDFSKKYSLRAGIEAGIVSKSLNILQLSFPDQFTNDGFQNTSSSDYYNKQSRIYYPDLSSGLLFFSTSFWAGLAVQHMNQPNQTFFASNGNARLPALISVHSGYKFILNKSTRYNNSPSKAKSITPTFLFKHQGSFNQLDLGVYYTAKPFFFGIWYRGIPFLKTVESYTNQDALVFQTGFRFDRLNLGYSFDYTISHLANYSRGSHEISLGYVFCGGYKKPKERLRTLPCPDFYSE